MNKPLLALLLPLCFSAQALAEVTLNVPMNYQILAVKNQHVTSATQEITFPAGEQSVLVVFNSRENPYNVNETSPVVRSKPIRLDFNAIDNSTLTLKVPQLSTTADIQNYAKSPSVTLLDASGNTLAHQAQLVSFSGSPMLADYNEILAKSLGQASALTVTNSAITTPTTTPAPAAVTTVKATETVAQNAPAKLLTTQERSQALQKLFLESSATERKDFLRWAIDQ